MVYPKSWEIVSRCAISPPSSRVSHCRSSSPEALLPLGYMAILRPLALHATTNAIQTRDVSKSVHGVDV